MPTYRSSPAATDHRLQALDAYMASNVLGPDGFVCSYGLECCSAAGAALERGRLQYFEGQMGYVGPHYDMYVNDIPWRSLFVGMEFGHGPAHLSRPQRTDHHERALGLAFPQRNAHMRGVTSALRYMYGCGIGENADGEYLPLADEVHPQHILHCYALVNLRLCSAIDGSSHRGRRSAEVAVMAENCIRHLTATVKILEPSIVIVQGMRIYQPTKQALGEAHPIAGQLPLVAADFGGVKTLVASFSHPAATNYGWSDTNDRYFKETVKPTLEAAIHYTVRRQA